MAVARRFLMPGAAGLGAAAAAPCGNATSTCGGRRGAAPPPNPPFWYSFEYGSVHFTVISTEHDLTECSDQRAVRLTGSLSPNPSFYPRARYLEARMLARPASNQTCRQLRTAEQVR